MNTIFTYMQESTDPGDPPRGYWIGLTKDAAGAQNVFKISLRVCLKIHHCLYTLIPH